MSSFFTLNIRTRLFLGFMILCLPIMILLVIILVKTSKINMLSKEIKQLNFSNVLDTQIAEARSKLYFWALTGSPDAKTEFFHIWDEMNKTIKETDEIVKDSNKEIVSGWDKIRSLYPALYKAQSQIINEPWQANNMALIGEDLKKIKSIGDSMIDLMDGVRSPITGEREGGLYYLRNKMISEHTEAVNQEIAELNELAYILLTLTIILSVLVPLLTARSILGPLNEAIGIAEKISAGERNMEIKVKTHDEAGALLSSLKTMQGAIKENEEKMRVSENEARQLFDRMVQSSKKFRLQSSKVAAGDLRERLVLSDSDVMQDLGNDLNAMTNSLAAVTKKITDVSTNIVNRIEKIKELANDASQSITSEASAINEISTSLEEIDKSSKQTMTKAQALRDATRNTREQGKLGADLVKDSIEGIKVSEEKVKMIQQTILDLSSHTQQIGEITAVVNTLAQQLKMLALNAAIEASKAGEAGKGFAAVATEVRNLAEQSEQSTDQVQKILEDIRITTEKAVVVSEEGTKTLNAGTKMIEKTGDVIQTLSKMIDEASISSQQIEAAIRQEAVGIEQIVTSMNEINQATGILANSVNETNSFINELAEISQHLKEDVNTYKV